jgi:hypothetical protein
MQYAICNELFDQKESPETILRETGERFKILNAG